MAQTISFRSVHIVRDIIERVIKEHYDDNKNQLFIYNATKVGNPYMEYQGTCVVHPPTQSSKTTAVPKHDGK